MLAYEYSYGLGGTELIKGSDGNFYGVSLSGGTNGAGCVIRVQTNGTITTLAELPESSWYWPHYSGLLAEGPDGAFYGVTSDGGSSRYGSIFRVTTNGELATLFEFTCEECDGTCCDLPSGGLPLSGLQMGADGLLYGTTTLGGEWGYGTLFRVSTNGTLTTLWSFDADQGMWPDTPLAKADDGAFWGVTSQGGNDNIGTAFRFGKDGTFTHLASFSCPREGAGPTASLLLATNGLLYGTTPTGGSNNCGTVFWVTTNGAVSFLPFSSMQTNRGCGPQGKLIQAYDGFLYGTTLRGGWANCGTVFRLSCDGEMTTLVPFDATNCCNPYAGLVQAADGALYGTANGSSSTFGAVFRVTLDGMVEVVASFMGTNGAYPQSDLVFGTDGELYGTITVRGVDVANSDDDRSTVFRVSTNGNLVTLACLDEVVWSPPSSLVAGEPGEFFGTSRYDTNYCGTIFRVTTNGSYQTLHTFGVTYSSAGYSPSGSLLRTADGSLYGTTSHGGRYGYGAVFVLRTNGVVEELASFSRLTGTSPNGGLTFGPDGALYGTAAENGSRGGGTVFRLVLPTPPEDPPLQLLPLLFPCGKAAISFTGPTGTVCSILRATNLSGPWITLGTATIHTNGRGSYNDIKWPASGAFYRVITP